MERKTEPDEPVKIPLDPEDALRALLQVKPDGSPEIVDAAEQELQTPEDTTNEG